MPRARHVKRPPRLAGALLLTLVLIVFGSPAFAQEESQLPDTGDAEPDAGKSQLERKGFLLLPVIISEPAVDMGLGLALGFIHDSQSDPGGRPARPSISGVAGAYTGNESWAVAGGHFGSWKQDTIRYIGAAGLAALNLDFFVGDSPFAYSMEGSLLLQDLKFRLGQSNFFLGGRFAYLDADASFEVENSIPGIEPQALDSTNVSLGAVIHYDSRDNQFTPGRGQGAWLTYSFFDTAFGGDFDYEQFEGKIHSYHPLHERFVLGLRLDYKEVSGEAPFYGLPFVNLRGIPMARYQDEEVGVAEVEGRWTVAGRWSMVAFGGSGTLNGDIPLFSEKETVWAGGLGVRYLFDPELGLHVGLDVAQGPEDTVVYIQIGSAWR